MYIIYVWKHVFCQLNESGQLDGETGNCGPRQSMASCQGTMAKTTGVYKQWLFSVHFLEVKWLTASEVSLDSFFNRLIRGIKEKSSLLIESVENFWV